MSAIVRQRRGVFAALAIIAIAAPAAAQDTRQEALAAERAEKAAQLRPYEPTPLERRIQAIDKMLTSERRVYSFIGSAYEGGGIAIGPGYRTHLLDERLFVDLGAGLSIRGNKSADANVRWWQGWTCGMDGVDRCWLCGPRCCRSSGRRSSTWRPT